MKTNIAFYAPLVAALLLAAYAALTASAAVAASAFVFALAWPWLYGAAWSVADVRSRARRREEAVE